MQKLSSIWSKKYPVKQNLAEHFIQIMLVFFARHNHSTMTAGMKMKYLPAAEGPRGS